jgi:hypothetical protein
MNRQRNASGSFWNLFAGQNWTFREGRCDRREPPYILQATLPGFSPRSGF